MDEDLSVWIEDVEKTEGVALLRRLHSVITQTSAGRVAALHDRFAQQKPCPNFWVLLMWHTECGRDLNHVLSPLLGAAKHG